MLARSFLFKLLDFSKSSRLVLVLTVVFVNNLNAHSKNDTSPIPRTQVKKSNRKLTNTPQPVVGEKFARTPTWPA